MAYLLKTNNNDDIRFRNSTRINTVSVILTILIASYASNKIPRLNNIQRAFITVAFVFTISYVSYPIVSYLSHRCMNTPTYNEVNNIFIYKL